MVTFPTTYDCKLGDQFWSMFADEVSKETVAKLVDSIKRCNKDRHLTTEQLGAELWSALQDVQRYNTGETDG